MYQRILVLLDGSTRAEHAIPLAARIARAIGGTLIFVDVVFSLSAASISSDETQLARAEDYLAYGIPATYAGDLAGISIERSVIMGAETSIVFAIALLERADILVIGSCDEAELRHQSIDTIAQEAIRHSPIPVLIVPERCVNLPDSLDDSHFRVLVPLDGSPEAETALEPAAQLISILAAPAPAMLQALHIVQKIALTNIFQENSNIDTFIREEEMQRKAATYLKSLQRRLSSLIEANDRLFINSSIVLSSSVTQAILEAEDRCSMLAMTSHTHALMDSFMELVLQRTKLPILIIRPHLSEIQVQPILPKEGLIEESDECDGGSFAWSLPGQGLDSLPCFYTF